LPRVKEISQKGKRYISGIKGQETKVCRKGTTKEIEKAKLGVMKELRI
jgi:hypothetical protein